MLQTRVFHKTEIGSLCPVHLLKNSMVFYVIKQEMENASKAVHTFHNFL